MVIQYPSVLGVTRRKGDFLTEPIVYFDDFITAYTSTTGTGAPAKFSTAADKGEWRVSHNAFTTNGFVPIVQDDADGGVVKFACDANSGDRTSCQLNGESFYLQEGRDLVFETRMALNAVANGSMFIGIATNDTDPFPAASRPSDFIAFTKSTNANINAEMDVTGGAAPVVTDTGDDFTINEFVTLAFEYDGADEVRYYVNGFLRHRSTFNVPKDKYMSPIMAVRSTGGSVQMSVDYIFVQNQRKADMGN
jgi:hypothetical protein